MKELTVAIVGHTNTGKTSLIRSLTHDRNFGEVRDEPSTTINVEQLAIQTETMSFTYVDTPGIEDAMGILDELELEGPIEDKREEAERLERFILNPAMYDDFEQEIKVLKQLFEADLTLYVVDTRLPFLPKFADELTLILQTHKPFLPILNFLNEGEYIDVWKEQLKARGIHHYLEFDTIVPPQKRRLYEQVAIMFPDYYENIQQFITQHELQQEELFHAALKEVANFYLNALTLQIRLPKSTPSESVLRELQNQVGSLEARSVKALLDLYRFNDEDVKLLSLQLDESRYEDDFFTSDNLINFSMQFGKGATVGAGVFAVGDVISGFSTLGAATATGAILGGVGNTLKFYGNKIWDKLNDIELYCVNNDAIYTLTARLLTLVGLLNGRSHAQLDPILLGAESKQDEPLMRMMRESARYRAFDSFSILNHSFSDNRSREKAINEITQFLETHYRSLFRAR